MAKTVNGAFSEYMRDVVNLDPGVVSAARRSRDNLLDNIAEFSGADGFFELCSEYNLHFGSFARKTKCRKLDDIDLMIGISAEGATYNSNDPVDDVRINANMDVAMQRECARDDGTLNSTKVANKFKKKLEEVREYSRSEVRRCGEAIILNLVSKEWSFDIVPCFFTVTEDDGRNYYLIPNGKGNWKKTDPRKDRDHVTNTNQSKQGRVLELIRLCKKWNEVKNSKKIPSYLLETLIINYCDSKSEISEWIDYRFRDVMYYIALHIMYSVNDMKEIQSNINGLSLQERITIQEKVLSAYNSACAAISEEVRGDMEASINKWREVFGNEFPEYEE